MVTFIFIVAFLATFVFGFLSAFVVLGLILRVDAEKNEGVWLTYNRKKDEWTSYGDFGKVYAKAFCHRKGIRKVLPE